jgi:PhoPQ-activated pathogenicity-related protein
MLPFRVLRVALVCAVFAFGAEKTPLDLYVEKPDPAYEYKVATTLERDGLTAAILSMTSQTWLTPGQVDRTRWEHWVTVVRPAEVKTNIGLLFIGGGANDGKPPRPDANILRIAREVGAVVTELRMVPNQPLEFHKDGKKRYEDDLIAYGWDQFLRSGDANWLARLPMTKAAVRAMDTVTDYCRQQGITVDKFVVAGASKRGWTTWTTGAVDKRVVSVVPIVIDLLNVVPSFEHHWRVYGFWAPAIKDYVEHGIVDWTGRPEYDELLRIVEPYSYRDRLTMPKLMINAAGDEFFLPDSSQFYFDGLKGEKYLRYVPNAGHGLRGTDAAETLLAWFSAIVNDRARPKFSWKKEKSGDIRLTAADKPQEVKLWHAVNPKARDFRFPVIKEAWMSTPLEPKGDTYLGRVPKPAEGYAAFFLELTYPSGASAPLKFTTEVSVVPDTYPFPRFQPDASKLPPARAIRVK